MFSKGFFPRVFKSCDLHGKGFKGSGHFSLFFPVMKIYMHSECPALTVVVQWEDNKEHKIKDLVDIFCKSLYQKYPSLGNSGANVTISSSTGKDLKYTGKVSQSLKNKDDVFIKIESAGSTNISQDLEAVTISESGKDKDKKLNDPGKNLKHDAQQVGRNLDGKRNAALVHMCNQRLRKAISIYQELLTTEKNDLNALKGLIRCYLKAGRPKDALKHCKIALKKEKEDTDILELAGETFIQNGHGEAAIEHLLKLCKILRQKCVGTASEKQDIQVLLAKAYLVENQKDMAITVLQGVLRENVEHADALAEYAALLFSIGTTEHREEAVSAILTALANKRNDKNVKQKFSEMMITEDGMAVLKKVAANVLTDASALMFLGITAREFGAIEQTLEFLELAYKAERSSVCILTFIHTLELQEGHAEALSHLLQHCRSFPEKGVGNVQFEDLIPYLEAIDHSFTGVNAASTSFKTKVGVVSSTPYTEEDLYMLALFFTVVKILYIKGLLSMLPPLLQLLQPLCEGRDLHLTLIRNEAAYFKCINEVFKTFSGVPETVNRKDKNHIYFIGDSHCIPVAWHQVTYKVLFDCLFFIQLIKH